MGVVKTLILWLLVGSSVYGQSMFGVVDPPELPVGSIYLNATDNTNPGTSLGYGTWVAMGAGKIPVTYDSGDTDFDSAEETGGAKTVTLTTNELPAHTHSYIGATIYNSNATGSASGGSGLTTGSTGSGNAYSIMNPYIVVYAWKRTA